MAEEPAGGALRGRLERVKARLADVREAPLMAKAGAADVALWEIEVLLERMVETVEKLEGGG